MTAMYDARMHAVVEGVQAVFDVFFESMQRTESYARLSIVALDEFQERGIDTAALENLDPHTDEGMRKLAEAAFRKMDIDFLKNDKAQRDAHVNAQATLSMWGILETFVDDAVLAVIAHDVEVAASRDIKKVEVSLGDFMALDDAGRAEELLNAVKQQKKSRLLKGADAFETFLNPFGLASAVADETKRELLEFSAVRNCITHRRGIVDRRFKEACPTSKRVVGERIALTASDRERYFFAACQYASTLWARTFAKYEPESKRAAELAEAMLELLKKARAHSPNPA